MALDEALYAEAERLASEQRRSVVWEAPAAEDLCAATEGVAHEALPAEPLLLSERVAIELDGDGARLFRLELPTHLRASLTLLLRARNEHGASAAG